MVGNLLISSDNGHENWSTGLAPFVGLENLGHEIIVGVRCRIDNLEEEEIALLDTGSTYTVINRELVRDIENQLIQVRKDQLKTCNGPIAGTLVELGITLLAEEGEDLPVDALALNTEDWHGPVVLGYRGFLEKIRIALDPGVTLADGQLFYFGSCE